MKKYLAVLFLAICTNASGQGTKAYKVEYRLTYRPDTTQNKVFKSELFSLFINDSISRFTSNQKLVKDSLALAAKLDEKLALELIANQDRIPKSDFKFDIYKTTHSQILVYESIFFENYVYIDKVNNWTIEDDTTNIGGYGCQKATLHFGGRNYEAWFTKEIQIKDGPYKFSGLPGLIIKIGDLAGDYVFNFVGIHGYDKKITLPNHDDYNEVDKIDFFQASKDRMKDLQKKIKHKIILSENAKSYLNRRHKSYNNPIEWY